MRQPTAHSTAKQFAEVFERMGWTWRVRGKRQVEPYVPNARQIQRTIERLVHTLESSRAIAASETGRIRVERVYDSTYAKFHVMLIAEQQHV